MVGPLRFSHTNSNWLGTEKGGLIRLDLHARYWLSILEDLACLTVLPSDFALRVAGKMQCDIKLNLISVDLVKLVED